MERDAERSRTRYLGALKCEWERWKQKTAGRKQRSIYFGGGTPSLLGPAAIGELIELFSPEEETEITLEANPEGLSASLLRGFRAAGVNRISFGLQSLQDAHLLRLGRNHSAQEALSAINLAHEVGFDNISADLMYELPRQTIEEWSASLRQLLDQPVAHISLYNLTIEPNTRFFVERQRLAPELPAPETCAAMYQLADTLLSGAGWVHYEISAFARDGKVSRHNTAYWSGVPYLGLGPSACSFWEGERFSNVASLRRWEEALAADNSPHDYKERLCPKRTRMEQLILGLRRLDIGIAVDPFTKLWGTFAREELEQIDELIENGLLTGSTSTKLTLTEKGMLFYEQVATALVVVP